MTQTHLLVNYSNLSPMPSITPWWPHVVLIQFAKRGELYEEETDTNEWTN